MTQLPDFHNVIDYDDNIKYLSQLIIDNFALISWSSREIWWN